jgi:hypothetical protein
MTRTISLITATVGAALLFAVPAYGDSWGLDKGRAPVRVSPDLVDRAVAAHQAQLETMLDARERSLGAGIGNNKVSAIEARERAFATKQVPAPAADDWFGRTVDAAIRDRRSPVVDDRFTIDPTSGQEPVTVSSGRDFELPQIGIGLGLGLMLALGLYLAMRYTRGRQLAH